MHEQESKKMPGLRGSLISLIVIGSGFLAANQIDKASNSNSRKITVTPTYISPAPEYFYTPYLEDDCPFEPGIDCVVTDDPYPAKTTYEYELPNYNSETGKRYPSDK